MSGELSWKMQWLIVVLQRTQMEEVAEEKGHSGKKNEKRKI